MVKFSLKFCGKFDFKTSIRLWGIKQNFVLTTESVVDVQFFIVLSLYKIKRHLSDYLNEFLSVS